MRISRLTGAASGFLIILLALWGGLIPLIGPYFHYSFGSNATWHLTSDRFWLSILPAAVALVGGFAMMGSSNRISGVFGSWMAIAAGAWFVVGPSLSRIWEHNVAGPIGAPLYGSTRQAIELIGYFYGVGVLIVALAAFALGRFISRPALATTSEDARLADQQPADAGYAEPAETKRAATAPSAAAAHEPAVAAPEDSTAPRRAAAPTTARAAEPSAESGSASLSEPREAAISRSARTESRSGQEPARASRGASRDSIWRPRRRQTASGAHDPDEPDADARTDTFESDQ